MKMLKLKAWIGEHKDEIKTESIRVFWYALGFGVAWFVNGKLTECENITNVLRLREMGLMKFVDPDTGLEITIEKVCDIAKRMKK